MSFFDKDGNSRHDWNIFLDNFPTIGVFKLPHDSNEAYYDKNVASMLHIEGDNMSKDSFYALLDSLNENQIEDYKNIYIYMYTAGGETSYIKIKIVYDTDYMLGFVQDVTQIMEARSHKDNANEYDMLTGMYTRDYFIKRVRSMLSEISGTAQCCMAAIHINGIERVDSELNYDKTALCVATAANAIKRFISDNVIIGVKSYKDFFIFFRQMTKSEISDIMKKMYDAVARCKLTDEFGNTIETRSEAYTITAGYCWYPSQAATIDMMINYADFALFRAKALGSIKREFSAEEYVAECNSYSDSKLLTGLIYDNNFSYCFQPIVSTVDGSVYAYEALMRPKNSSPLEVLRIAREHGRLYDIERLTFENVLEIISANRARFGEKKIFINSIPNSMITEYDFNRLCEKYGNIMSQLVIEFTEQADLTGDKIASLRYLFKSKSCMIAIDDYGSGYSNTAAVLSLQPDVIKVDRSLIADINTNVKKQHFLTGIIDFARLNNIKVLAEGVETYDEMSVTIRRGVDFIQGFYTAKPQKEIVPDIPDAVAEQMRMLNMCRPEIKKAHDYIVHDGCEEHLDIEKLLSGRYTGVIVENAVAHLYANGCDVMSFVIKTAEGSKSHIILENANIKGALRQCIRLGENSDTTLEIKGTDFLSYDGISVPGSSKLLITGNGNLYIDSYRNDGCCIGSGYNDTFGEITINVNGNVELQANGDHGICIGGGVSPCETPIKLLSGNIKMSSTGKDCIGAGSCDGSCGIETGNATIDISCSGNNALAVGSLCGYTDIKADGTTFLIRSLGERAGCIGSLAALDGSTPSRINIKNSTLNLSLNALCGSAVGCRKTACDTVISDSDIAVHVEGDAVAGIGSAEGKGSLLIKNSDIKSSSSSGVYSLEIGFMNKGCIINNSTINSHLINDPDYHEPSRLMQQN